jgi:hypothetical protein
MDMLVLLPDTATYHLRRGRLPMHQMWPTRTPPKEIRVDDGTRGRVPHQAARPSRQHLPVPARRSPVPDMGQPDVVAEGSTARMWAGHRREQILYANVTLIMLYIIAYVKILYAISY